MNSNNNSNNDNNNTPPPPPPPAPSKVNLVLPKSQRSYCFHLFSEGDRNFWNGVALKIPSCFLSLNAIAGGTRKSVHELAAEFKEEGMHLIQRSGAKKRESEELGITYDMLLSSINDESLELCLADPLFRTELFRQRPEVLSELLEFVSNKHNFEYGEVIVDKEVVMSQYFQKPSKSPWRGIRFLADLTGKRSFNGTTGREIVPLCQPLIPWQLSRKAENNSLFQLLVGINVSMTADEFIQHESELFEFVCMMREERKNQFGVRLDGEDVVMGPEWESEPPMYRLMIQEASLPESELKEWELLSPRRAREARSLEVDAKFQVGSSRWGSKPRVFWNSKSFCLKKKCVVPGDLGSNFVAPKVPPLPEYSETNEEMWSKMMPVTQDRQEWSKETQEILETVKRGRYERMKESMEKEEEGLMTQEKFQKFIVKQLEDAEPRIIANLHSRLNFLGIDLDLKRGNRTFVEFISPYNLENEQFEMEPDPWRPIVVSFVWFAAVKERLLCEVVEVSELLEIMSVCSFWMTEVENVLKVSEATKVLREIPNEVLKDLFAEQMECDWYVQAKLELASLRMEIEQLMQKNMESQAKGLVILLVHKLERLLRAIRMRKSVFEFYFEPQKGFVESVVGLNMASLYPVVLQLMQQLQEKGQEQREIEQGLALLHEVLSYIEGVAIVEEQKMVRVVPHSDNATPICWNECHWNQSQLLQKRRISCSKRETFPLVNNGGTFEALLALDAWMDQESNCAWSMEPRKEEKGIFITGTHGSLQGQWGKTALKSWEELLGLWEDEEVKDTTTRKKDTNNNQKGKVDMKESRTVRDSVCNKILARARVMVELQRIEIWFELQKSLKAKSHILDNIDESWLKCVVARYPIYLVHEKEGLVLRWDQGKGEDEMTINLNATSALERKRATRFVGILSDKTIGKVPKNVLVSSEVLLCKGKIEIMIDCDTDEAVKKVKEKLEPSKITEIEKHCLAPEGKFTIEEIVLLSQIDGVHIEQVYEGEELGGDSVLTINGGKFAAENFVREGYNEEQFGEDVKVAVIDYMFDIKKFTKKTTTLIFLNMEGEVIPKRFHPSPRSGHEHGTCVASIVKMVAPACHLILIELPEPKQGWNTKVLRQALVVAQREGAKVINLSGGWKFSGVPPSYWEGQDSIGLKIKELQKIGILVVGAAGNSHAKEGEVSLWFPALSPYSICVGSCSCEEMMAPDSSRGNMTFYTKPDLVAPGVKIKAGGIKKSGTSMAAPHVSGAVAILLSLGLNYGLVLRTLQLSARSLGMPMYVQGAGLLNIGNALRLVYPLIFREMLPKMMLAESAISRPFHRMAFRRCNNRACWTITPMICSFHGNAGISRYSSCGEIFACYNKTGCKISPSSTETCRKCKQITGETVLWLRLLDGTADELSLRASEQIHLLICASCRSVSIPAHGKLGSTHHHSGLCGNGQNLKRTQYKLDKSFEKLGKIARNTEYGDPSFQMRGNVFQCAASESSCALM